MSIVFVVSPSKKRPWFDGTAKEPGRVFHGESASMSTLSQASMQPLNSATLDGAVIADDAPSSNTIPWRDLVAADDVPSSSPWRNLVAAEGPQFLVKRVIDVIGALLSILLLSSVMGIIALSIRMCSPGPVLFRQVRRGYRGRSFEVLKFRTMTVDAEQRLNDLESSNESHGGVLFKLRQDPRVTWLGSFLRRSSLDELPQLVNVLRGEMSLVGPRPLQLRDSDLLLASDPEGYRRRLEVLPGLTGPWQVGGRSDLNHERMVELDVDYVDNWSVGRDLAIICKTFLVVLFRVGAY
jgi:lipopolysaccharide/colanic/teichoic acid biosynthesis glycosyltransferase